MSSKKALFTEVQNQNGAVAWLILAGLAAVSFSLMFSYYEQWEINEKFTYKGLAIFASLIILLFFGLYFLFKNMKMETRIDMEGIHFRYPPFQRKFKDIPFSQIDHFEVCEYQPIKEYGGWGFKKPAKPKSHKRKLFADTKNKNTAYTIKGKIGLRIRLSSQEVILLGTQRKAAMEYTLKKLLQY